MRHNTHTKLKLFHWLQSPASCRWKEIFRFSFVENSSVFLLQNIAFNSVYKLIKSYFSSFLVGADPREEDYIKEHEGKLT